jgi:hypothetical protein
MTITICGSMTFAKEMLKVRDDLEKLGHEVKIARDTEQVAKGEHDSDDLEADYEHCLKYDLIREHFHFIETSDAILVLNYEKNGIKGYIGASVLIEIAVAYYLKKKIFILKKLPEAKQQPLVHEIKIMQPIVINDDLSEINYYYAKRLCKKLTSRKLLLF